VANLMSLLPVLLLIGGLAAAAVFLRAYRDRLNKHFVKGPIRIEGMAHLGDGSRLVLVDIEGTRVACGVGRQGISAMQIIAGPDKGTDTP
jgi:flagellar biogenesis protein FliO